MNDQPKMGLNATWSMAVGGMVGGGIFSVLGVILQMAGEWAWLSFVLAGVVALLTGHSYVSLSAAYHEGGGAFTFLRKIGRPHLAGDLSWILLLGYVLTISVYGFTFGHYLNSLFGWGAWFPRVSAAAIIVLLMGVNLVGVGEASWLEILTVWGKLFVLLGLAVFGLIQFSPENLKYAQADPGGLTGAIVGAASIFMAYEGFQLLTYDYADIRDPERTLRIGVISAILCVIAIYVTVTLGAASLVGADKIIQKKEISLAYAGEAAFGLTGKILVSIAAAFSTASAINATLFATARLSKHVSEDGELPKIFTHENSSGIPDRSLFFLGAASVLLSVTGGLSDLVEAASLAFLFTFATVNFVAALHTDKWTWLSWLGGAISSVAGLMLIWRLFETQPVSLALILLMVGLVLIGRRYMSKRTQDG
ncbi:MAG: amino acid permease [Candidatus Omnitrophica bacterium]|nr:amino acid permease [Candidatus Omnitrophota bacterium]MCB9782506.1 amino acid permease [Candidatus Omnitrophota bacterium]